MNMVEEHGSDCWWTQPTEVLLPKYVLEKSGFDPEGDYVKGSDILDIWFDSGASWATVLKDSIADVYMEGMDQLTGWFQSSLLSSVAVNSRSPYKSLLVHGFTVDENGKKMSKSLGNIIHPSDVIKGNNSMPSFGVDVLRWWAASSMKKTNIEMGPNTINRMNEQMFRLRFIIRFLLGNLNGIEPSQNLVNYENLLPQDKYLLHKLREFMSKVQEAYDSYHFGSVLTATEQFSNIHVNVYINVIKDRLYCDEEGSPDRRAAQTTMYHVLNGITCAVAPVLPHLAEEIRQHHPSYRNISNENCSVFKAGWYRCEEEWRNPQICSLIELAVELREKFNRMIGSEKRIEFDLTICATGSLYENLKCLQKETVSAFSCLTEVTQAAQTRIVSETPATIDKHAQILHGISSGNHPYTMIVTRAAGFCCQRCRRYISEQSNAPCSRCMDTIAQEWAEL